MRRREDDGEYVQGTFEASASSVDTPTRAYEKDGGGLLMQMSRRSECQIRDPKGYERTVGVEQQDGGPVQHRGVYKCVWVCEFDSVKGY